jgi:hypothetical protein
MSLEVEIVSKAYAVAVTDHIIWDDPNPMVSEKKTPGLEAVSAIAGLLVINYLMR